MRAVTYDPTKNCYYLSDLLRQSVISLSASDAAETELVNEYEGAPLLGPHSLLVSNSTGNIFFSDCGPFAETAASSAQGSLFVIDMQQQSIRSLALRCLSSPTGLAFANEERIIYLSETGRNRILRFYESKEGIYYMRYSPGYAVSSTSSTAGSDPLPSPPPTTDSSSPPSSSSGLSPKRAVWPS